jgi:hypothetical protein
MYRTSPDHRFPSNASNNSKHLENMKTTRTSTAVILTSVLALTGCAAWNKYDLRKVTITAPSGSPSVAVACVDQRETLRQGDIGPELIGVTRSGFGVPYRVKTASKSPVAKEIAEVVVRGFGTNRKLAPPMSYADTNSAKAALRGTGTDRQILVLIDRYNSDTLIRTELDYSIKIEVYDNQGRLLASASRTKIADLGGNFFLPALHARQSVLRTTSDVLNELLSTPEIRSALQ